MTPNKTQLPYPLFRAWYQPAAQYVKDGYVTLDNKFMIMANGKLVPLDFVHIEFFTGIEGVEDHQPVYQNDIVSVGVRNEFGSVTLHQAIVRYYPSRMGFSFEDVDGKLADVFVESTILRVLGQHHD